MAKANSSPILQTLRGMVEDQRVKNLDDRELLGRFVNEHDQAAFHALMRRHGPVVLDVCRSMLVNQADAEDAFQATFLVFARKAKGIRAATSIGSWLHGVAYRVALKAQTAFARRKKHESLAPARAVVESADDMAWRDVKAVVHRELNTLPERFRAVLVICYLEGKTQDEAALQLKLPKGTLKGRLEQGRATLRERLIRRGLGPAAVLVASAWTASDSAALQPTLIGSTVLAAANLAAGRAASEIVSTKVITLTEGVVKAMYLTKLKIATAILLVLSIFGASASAFIHGTPAAKEIDNKDRSAQTSAGLGKEASPDQAKTSSPQQTEAPEVNRAVAEWVIAMGGKIVTAAGIFGKGNPLGDGQFYITAIILDSIDKIKDDDLARLKDLTKLNNLSLVHTPIGDAGLKHLAGIKSLETLYLAYTKVGDAGLAHLKDMTGLVNLYLDGTKVTDAGLEHLAGMKGLAVLCLKDTQITDAGLKQLKSLSNLSWVDMWGAKVTDAGVKDLQAALPKCTIKNVDPKNDRPPLPAGAREAALAALRKTGGQILPGERNGVYGVYLVGPKIDDTLMMHLSAIEEIQSVLFFESKVTDAGLAHLKWLKNLKNLTIEKSPISDAGLKNFKDMSQLREIHMNFMPLTDAGLEHLKGLSGLTTLGFDSANITDAGVKHLKGMVNLKDLCLARTQITDACAANFDGMTKLEKIDLFDTDVGDATLEHLKGLKNLKFLIFKRTNVTEAGVKKLEQALPNCEISYSPRN
jgi:internalin A